MQIDYTVCCGASISISFASSKINLIFISLEINEKQRLPSEQAISKCETIEFL